jgi:hypothetical protein
VVQKHPDIFPLLFLFACVTAAHGQVAWVSRASGTTVSLNAVASSTAGNLVAVGDNGIIRTSPDGITWSGRTSGVPYHLRGVAFSGSLWVAVGDSGAVLTSPDAITWTYRAPTTQNKLAKHQSFKAVTWADTQFVAVGQEMLESPTVKTSSTGTGAWESRVGFFQVYGAFHGVAGGAGGTVLAAGRAYEDLTGYPPSAPEALMVHLYKLSTGTVFWGTPQPQVSDTLFATVWTGSQWIAAGKNGGCSTSPNGLDWTPHPLSSSHTVYSLVRVGTQVVAVGAFSGADVTADGLAWETKGAGTGGASLRSVTWTGSQLVAVGAGGTIFTSTNIVPLHPGTYGAPVPRMENGGLRFTLPRRERVQVRVLDVAGSEQRVFDGFQEAGSHSLALPDDEGRYLLVEFRAGTLHRILKRAPR